MGNPGFDNFDLDTVVDVAGPPNSSFADVPDKAWVLVKNTTREQKEGAQPKIKTITGGRNGDWYTFNTGFVVVGGNAAIKNNHLGRYIFYQCNTHFNPEKDNAAMPCGGQLYKLILDTLAPVDAPVATKWHTARAIMAVKAAELAYDVSTFKGDTQLLYASVFKELLLDKAYTIIAQTYTPKPREGKSYQPGQTIGSITSDMTVNRTEHKIKVIGEDEF